MWNFLGDEGWLGKTLLSLTLVRQSDSVKRHERSHRAVIFVIAEPSCSCFLAGTRCGFVQRKKVNPGNTQYITHDIADCGCNGYASTCHYDSVSRHGVCDSCVNMTAGDKCQQCLQFYFVNPLRNFTACTAGQYTSVCPVIIGVTSYGALGHVPPLDFQLFNCSGHISSAGAR